MHECRPPGTYVAAAGTYKAAARRESADVARSRLFYARTGLHIVLMCAMCWSVHKRARGNQEKARRSRQGSRPSCQLRHVALTVRASVSVQRVPSCVTSLQFRRGQSAKPTPLVCTTVVASRKAILSAYAPSFLAANRPRRGSFLSLHPVKSGSPNQCKLAAQPAQRSGMQRLGCHHRAYLVCLCLRHLCRLSARGHACLRWGRGRG